MFAFIKNDHVIEFRLHELESNNSAKKPVDAIDRLAERVRFEMDRCVAPKALRWITRN